MRNNILHLFLLLTMMLVVSCSDNLLSDIDNMNSEEILTSDFSTNEKNSLIQGANLLGSFSIMSTRSVNKEDYDYPDYYGGSYVDDQGKLVVLVSSDNIEKYRQNFVRRTQSNEIILKSCEYSFKDLLTTIDEIKKSGEQKALMIDDLQLVSYGVDAQKNKVVVAMIDCNDQKIAKFKSEIMDSPIIIFEHADSYPLVESYPIQPGEEIRPGSTYSAAHGSIGYRAKDRSGNKGIVVSGHVIPNGGSLFYNNQQIGVCVDYMQGSSIDAAFCQITNSFYEPSNVTIYGNVSLYANVSLLFQGQVAYKEGYVTNKTNGVVQKTNLNVKFKQMIAPNQFRYFELSNITSTRYKSDEGDSGGIVYNSAGWICGIHEGSDANYAYYCLASEIDSLLQLSPY